MVKYLIIHNHLYLFRVAIGFFLNAHMFYYSFCVK